jgi:ATP-dependent helicase/nuclease subunit A
MTAIAPNRGRLTDQAARERISTATESTLFVEAGAGSGKTKSLIDRVITLVLDDGVPVGNLAAVTFTEKAGAELRDRLRGEFEKVWRASDGERKQRAAAALDDLDSAAIGTLHSFAQRILTLHPIEAGLPPLIEVLDEVASSVAFDERWSVMQRELLDDADISEALLLALSANVKLEQLRSLARAFGADWDLIEDRVLSSPAPEITVPEVSGLAERAHRLAARAVDCRKTDDKFVGRLTALAEWAEQLTAARQPSDQYAALLAAAKLSWAHGQQKNWEVGHLDRLRQDCGSLQADVSALAAEFADAMLRPIAYWIATRVRDAALQRAAEGRLEFHDLLVLARGLLRERADVRGALQQQFPRLLLDEFQDTDPIQVELAVRIAGGVDAGAPDWRDVTIPPGSIFVVGDPKQSIYRFRRASIETYLGAQDWFDQTVRLTTNFRTVPPVLDWVNAVFGRLIQPEAAAQPAYEALDSHRTETGDGPAVTVLGATQHAEQLTAGELRECEAADVAAVISRALRDRWTVHDERAGRWRPVRLGDIAILLPARTSLALLEDALDAAGIPYRAESSSLVYQAGEVRDLMAAARAVADPSDLLSTVTVLRSALFGCGDDDLWNWKRTGGSFNLLAPVPDEVANTPVGQSLTYLRRLHRESRWMTPSEVLGAVIADRRMLEVAAASPRARDKWRRLRFVVDSARAWSEVEHGGLRAYLAWARRQGEETSRVAEAVLPETDVDAVRILTIHAAKGLEFPMVVLSGMTSQARNNGGVQLLWKPDGYAVRLSGTVQTNDFEQVQPVDEQMDQHERRRLLYVAATRARDHLVVSLHRTERKNSTNARLLAEVQAGTAAEAESFAAGDSPTPEPKPAAVVAPPPDWWEWLARIEAARESSRRVTAVSASGLEGTDPAVALDVAEQRAPAGAAKGARDVELPPWSKGRYGSAVGRAVHGVLQTVSLTDGSGLDEAVSSQCIAEGVLEYGGVVAALVRSALNSDLVRRAAARPHWRESYAGTVQRDGTLVEGVIDLIYREDDGSLVVVDYKTDAIPAGALPARTAYYRPQIAAYVDMLKDATADARVTGRLLFLNPSGVAVETA